MVILDLVLKAHWYEMIKTGKKQSEYREVKPYWTKRLFSKAYTHVRFRRGYTKDAIIFEIADIALTKKENDLNLAEAYEIRLGAEAQEGKFGKNN